MAQEFALRVNKCTLILTETELMQCLSAKPEIFKKAVGKGKGYLRATSTKKRLAEDFDRWQLYEVLKGNRSIDNATFDWVLGMSEVELREGVCAFLERLKQCKKRIIEK